MTSPTELKGTQEPSGPLRFVLLVNGPTLYRWQFAALQNLLDSGLAKLGLVVVNGSAAEAFAPKLQGLDRYFHNPQILWNLYNRFTVNKKCRAIDPVLWGDLSSAPVIETKPYRIGKFSEGIDEDTLDAINASKPDFILRFGFGILKEGILDVAQYGIWSFHHGNPAKFRGLPPAFWEISQRCPTTGVILQRLGTKLDDGQILHQGWFKTTPHSLSRTLDTIFMGAAHFVTRVCAEVIATGTLPDVFKEPPGPVYRAPTNRDTLRFFWRLTANRLGNIIRYKLKRQQWGVGVVDAPIRTVAGLDGAAAQTAALATTKWMPEKSHRFFADPFALPSRANDEDVTLVFEDFDWRKDLGNLSKATFSKVSGFSDPENLISDGSHFSYPFILTDGEKIFCIPENIAKGRTDYYQIDATSTMTAQKFGTLSDLPLVDPTILQYDGLFWLFASRESTTVNTELHLYYSDKLGGEWTPHPLNPVKTDVRSARPGGSIFLQDGAFYRPAQDCSVNYGGRLLVNRIDLLSTTGYSETIVGNVDPIAGSIYAGGLHTLAEAGSRTLIDGCRYPWFFRW